MDRAAGVKLLYSCRRAAAVVVVVGVGAESVVSLSLSLAIKGTPCKGIPFSFASNSSLSIDKIVLLAGCVYLKFMDTLRSVKLLSVSSNVIPAERHICRTHA